MPFLVTSAAGSATASHLIDDQGRNLSLIPPAVRARSGVVQPQRRQHRWGWWAMPT